MKLGEKQVLMMEKEVDFGVYLGTESEHVLLPKKQVPRGLEPGDPVEVFLYKDSRDRQYWKSSTPGRMEHSSTGDWRKIFSSRSVSRRHQ